MDDRYAALLFSRARRAAGSLGGLPVPASTHVALYETPEGLTVAALVAAHHGEDLFMWLNVAHERISASSSLAGIITVGAVPPRAECHLLRLRPEAVTGGRIEVLARMPQAFCLLVGEPMEVFALLPSTSALEALRALGGVAEVHSGLVPVSTMAPQPAPPRPLSGRPYDPLAAQISETLTRTVVAVAEQLRGLGQLWADVRRTPPPDIFVTAAGLLEQIAQKIREHHRADIILSVTALDQILQVLSKKAARLNSQLSDERIQDLLSGAHLPYSVAARRVCLGAANELVRECLERFGIRVRTEVMLGDYTRINLDPFRLRELSQISVALGLNPPRQFEPLSIITLARGLQVRLGALPVLANSVARQFDEQQPHGWLETVMLDGDLGGCCPLWERSRARLREALRDEGDWDRTNRLMTRLSWARQLGTDALAAAVCGPAYVYALARFATGTLRHRDERDEMPDHVSGFPPITMRVEFCISVLRGLGHEVLFQSEYLTTGVQALGHPILEALTGKVRIYSREEHHRAITTVRESLVGGQVLQEKPTAVLNALWHAVVRREGYVNEIAVGLSCQGKA